MNKLLWKILLNKQGKWQFLIAGAGFCIGLFILLLSVQLYYDFNQILFAQQEKENQSSYLLINKTVTLLNTFDKSISGFTPAEIDTVKQQDFFVSIGEFQTNQFAISANLTMQLGFSTDLFFEAIPDKFIDNKPEEFKWEAEKNFVPVIVSTEFLNLYNFGYAMTQGLPQLPPDAIKMFPFDVTIKGKGKEKKFSARVVAFSDRVPSVLVPLDFMTWANAEFGEGAKQPSRLIAEVKDAGDERMKLFLEKKKYITNQEQMKTQKAGAVLKMVITLTGAVGVLFVALSFVIFVLNFQLALSRAKQEIDILLNIGYTRQSISGILTIQLVLILLLVVAASFAGHLISIEKIHGFFAQHGFVLVAKTSLALLVSVSAAALMLLVNTIALKISLR
ncbi:MAG: hypothetical protein SH857_08220 [Chitinophagales bacterium]|nr:hypothetical protein [Chitinophagales bacterium]